MSLLLHSRGVNGARYLLKHLVQAWLTQHNTAATALLLGKSVVEVAHHHQLVYSKGLHFGESAFNHGSS